MADSTIGEMVKYLNILIEKQLAQQLESHHTKFTSTQAQVIAYLIHHEDESVHQKDLETVMNLSRPTINGIIKRLMAKDTINLVEDPRDRRSKQIVLTAQTKKDAKAHQKNFEKDQAAIEARITNGLSPAQVAAFKDALHHCIQNLADH